MPILFLLFIVVPVGELMLLLKVGAFIGTFNTILLVFLTAILGTALLRREGVATLTSINQKLQRGEMPTDEIVAGFALAAGGALLLTPGFATDLLGFALVLPGSRHVIGRWLVKKFSASANFTMYSPQSGFQQGTQREQPQSTVIEGEFEKNPDK